MGLCASVAAPLPVLIAPRFTQLLSSKPSLACLLRLSMFETRLLNIRAGRSWFGPAGAASDAGPEPGVALSAGARQPGACILERHSPQRLHGRWRHPAPSRRAAVHATGSSQSCPQGPRSRKDCKLGLPNNLGRKSGLFISRLSTIVAQMLPWLGWCAGDIGACAAARAPAECQQHC